MKLTVSSTAFEPGKALPRQYTGEGPDTSPPLSWTGIPDGTAELSLIVDDPDAPGSEPWVHWVIYKIPAGTTGLKEGIAKSEKLTDPAGTLQGKNSWKTVGYRGPMPPPGHGTHHYHFRLYALDKTLTIPAGLTKAELLAAMREHVRAEGELVGTYKRSSAVPPAHTQTQPCDRCASCRGPTRCRKAGFGFVDRCRLPYLQRNLPRATFLTPGNSVSAMPTLLARVLFLVL